MTKNTEKTWNFDNSYTDLPHTFFSSQKPTPVSSPTISIFNEDLATSLGLDPEQFKQSEGIRLFAGNEIPEGAEPIAQAYAGHQFGHFTMLGDGRAVLLGEQITPTGERFDIQLKGSGRTPYSRGGDGRATLGPMLREYIISEAMHGLGIPTTRSLAVVKTGEPVMRETVLPGAVLVRVAASHIRVGTFQYAANFCDVEELKELADYTIKRHYPEIETSKDMYLSFLQEVMKRQASLIAKWQLVGMIHGVMNTDNMAISGETIDYGPVAFMNEYDPATVFSSIDRNGRYAYANQPPIAAWNLTRFAETLLPLLHDNQEKAVDLAQEEITKFPEMYKKHWLNGMRKKLGIFNEEQEDEMLANNLFDMMKKNDADFTNTFRALTLGQLNDMEFCNSEEFKEWHDRWKSRLSRQKETVADSEQLMKKSNPSIIPRNHRVEEALEAAVKKEDYTVMEKLLHVLSNPYAYSSDQEEYTDLPPKTDQPYRTFCGT
ncbi:uncharacterized protein YdiU (UPF0061 family) [Salirhabdus euzebyi]|uniref:Protein nucleotidyltransferase YdiU n=1 Tax=Salirhabdus euzebyi TaxID=394506 RepID=A0A841Q4B0_9BACI|nr:YdiU family protein [Salirhabdus euzebyi]MBB6453192.1 uncharacterized protein YdiU (UPF0061 family) [Salirhabdus euzebyi]